MSMLEIGTGRSQEDTKVIREALLTLSGVLGSGQEQKTIRTALRTIRDLVRAPTFNSCTFNVEDCNFTNHDPVKVNAVEIEIEPGAQAKVEKL